MRTFCYIFAVCNVMLAGGNFLSYQEIHSIPNLIAAVACLICAFVCGFCGWQITRLRKF